MDTLSIDGENFFYKFHSGVHEVLKFRDHLNKINVFPVADGDTGTNLALTMNSIIEHSTINGSVTDVAQSIADAAITGARGNSGIIFAQFTQGISDALHGKKNIDLKEYAAAMKTAVQYAYDAINKPVEGTILTVMKDWAQFLHEFHHKARNFSDLIARSVEEARRSLKQTPEKLDVLKKAGVVDAGAEGFVRFLEGIENYIVHKKEIILKHFKHTDLEEEGPHEIESVITHRYCTEAILKGENLDTRKIREILAGFGESVIVAGNKERIRMHIHTNTPDIAVQSIAEFGVISDPKVDDMKKQNDTQFHRKYKIALLTDSSCDLPDEIMDKYQIHMVPLNIVYKENQFLDKLTMKHGEFYKILQEDQENYPTSSQPSVKTFENFYSELTSFYDHVIAVLLSGNLSGTFNTGQIAAKKFGDKITVLNSKTLATSLGLIVLQIAREIEKGTGVEKIIEKASFWIRKSDTLVGVRTLKYLVRSGRVSPLKGFIAKILNLKPIVCIDEEGSSVLLDKSLGFDGSIKKIVKKIEKKYPDPSNVEYVIAHVRAEYDAIDFAEKLKKVLKKDPLHIMDASPIVGAHAGIGSVCVSIQPK
ncbi:DAK2 domain-containing protein [candidate division KSB1 bacterium]